MPSEIHGAKFCPSKCALYPYSLANYIT